MAGGYDIIFHYIIPYYTLPYCTILSSTILYAILCYTIPYSRGSSAGGSTGRQAQKSRLATFC